MRHEKSYVRAARKIDYMLIGLLADTHIPTAAQVLPQTMFEVFGNVDLILHAGDIYEASVLDELERLAPVLAAEGDDDYGAVLNDCRLKGEHVLELGGLKLWLVHERPRYYLPTSPLRNQTTGQHMIFLPDIVVFGHEHHTTLEYYGNTMIINPGSPTFLNYRRGPGTVGILEINEGQAQVRFVNL